MAKQFCPTSAYQALPNLRPLDVPHGPPFRSTFVANLSSYQSSRGTAFVPHHHEGQGIIRFLDSGQPGNEINPVASGGQSGCTTRKEVIANGQFAKSGISRSPRSSQPFANSPRGLGINHFTMSFGRRSLLLYCAMRPFVRCAINWTDFEILVAPVRNPRSTSSHVYLQHPLTHTLVSIIPSASG
jgi:hypothetical protein